MTRLIGFFTTPKNLIEKGTRQMDTTTVNESVLREEQIGGNGISWIRTPSHEHIVNISISGQSDALKSWTFEHSPVSEAVSFYWYDYVVREMKQHLSTQRISIPEVLMTTTADDAEKMIQTILSRLTK